MINNVSTPPSLVQRFMPLWVSLGAFVLYCVTQYDWLFAGDSVNLIASYTGAWVLPGVYESHPLVSGLFRNLTLSVGGLGIASALVSALTVGLLYQTVYTFYKVITTEPHSVKHIEPAARLGAGVTALVYAVLTPVWQAATHFQYQPFDLFLLLLAFSGVVHYMNRNHKLVLLASTFLMGLLVAEMPYALLLAPLFFVVALVALIMSQSRFTWLRVLPFLGIPMILGIVGGYALAISQSMAAGCEGTTIEIFIVLIKQQIMFLSALTMGPWLLVMFFAIAPFFMAVLSAGRFLNNDRSGAAILTFVAIVVLTILAVLPFGFSPMLTMSTAWWNDAYPLPICMMVAFSMGFVFCVAKMINSVMRAKEATTRKATSMKLAQMAALVLPVIMALATVIALLITNWRAFVVGDNTVRLQGDSVTSVYISALVDSLQGRNYVLTDGVFDPYLAVALQERDMSSVTLIPLTQDMNSTYIKRFTEELRTSDFMAEDLDLKATLIQSLQLGVLPFVQDWMTYDPKITEKLAIIGLPDFWYIANKYPYPHELCYLGVVSPDDFKQLDKTKAIDFLNKMDALLPLDDVDADKDAKRVTPTAMGLLKQYMRRHVGFIANNTGFYLAEVGENDEAYELFAAVRAFDKDNVSTLFNLFELINSGMRPEQRDVIGKEIESFVKNLKGRKYQLWSLSRYYGYIRSPQMMGAIAGQWALSGQTGAALTGMGMAMNMMDEDQRQSAQQAIASIYSMIPGQRREAEARYLSLLKASTDEYRSVGYLKELFRIAILDMAYVKAEDYLKQAEKLIKTQGELGFEWAIFYMAQGDTTKARLSLQTYSTLYPRNLEALAMLASIQMQNDEELEDVKNITLRRMEAAVGSPNNYFIQIIKAQIFMKEDNLVKAREAFIRAYALRSDVVMLRDTILQLDMALLDRTSAELHARQIIRVDRGHAMANYVMGSIRLSDGDRASAIIFLKAAAEATTPYIPAINDLAEAYRREGDFEQAILMAQKATKLGPSLYIAWETLASILCENKKYNEAAPAIEKARELWASDFKDKPMDPRILMTDARIKIGQGKRESARIALHEISKSDLELSDYEKEELAEIRELAK